MATIKDIAEALGVSRGTVSKALNNAPDISDALKEKIVNMAVQLGYTTKRSRKLEHRKAAILIMNTAYKEESQFGYDIVLGFRQMAYRKKWSVEIIEVTSDMQRAESYDAFLISHQFTGAFLIGFTLSEPWMQDIKSTKLPTVLLDIFLANNPTVCSVMTDSREGILLAITHLYLLGHKKIAFAGAGHFSYIFRSRERCFMESMLRIGLEADPDLIFSSGYTAQSQEGNLEPILRKGATAVICASDDAAFGIIKACHQKGLRVPEDLSVIGFDDNPPAALSDPPLTTIRQNRRGLGLVAFEAFETLSLGFRVSRMVLRPKLVVRCSTGSILADSSDVPRLPDDFDFIL